MMKEGAVIINCARGKVVDEIELLNALNTGKIAGAGIDVFEEEPTKNNELINHPINWDNMEKTRPIPDGFIVTE